MRWLQYEHNAQAVNSPQATELEQDLFSLQLAYEDVDDQVEQPQILGILRETRRFNIPFFGGTLRTMPYIFRMELNAAVDAEIEFNEILAANIRIKAGLSNEHQ